MRRQDRLITRGCLISENNASAKMYPSNSDNAERTLSKAVKNTDCRQKTCVLRQEKPILISSPIINQITAIPKALENTMFSRHLIGGEGGIRTLETLLTPTRFPIVRARPTTRLLHGQDDIYIKLSWKLMVGLQGLEPGTVRL